MNVMELANSPAVLRVIAETYNEDRREVEQAFDGHLESIGRAGTEHSFTNLRLGQILIEGECVTEAASNYLRGLGYNVERVDEIALVDRKKARDMGKRLVDALKGGKKVQQLSFFNEEKDVKMAQKIWKEIVEANNFRYFNNFLRDMDNLVMRYRDLEGHDDQIQNGPPGKPAPMKGNKGKHAVASEEDNTLDPLYYYDADGNQLGKLADLPDRANGG